MANRPGFGQVQRRPGVPVPAAVGPATGAGGGGAAVAASAFGSLARTLAGVSAEAHQRYDKQVSVAAERQGVEDAISGNVRTLDRTTTRGGAYHDAAVSTMGTIVETNAMVALADLYRENASNPAGLQEGVDLYSEGVLGELSAIDPGAAVRLRAQIVTHAIPMVNGAVANREKVMADAVKAAREHSEEVLDATVASHAEFIFSEDPEASAAALSGVLDAQSRLSDLRATEGAEAFLLSRLTNGHGNSHIVNMQPELKSRLAALIDAAPEGIAEGLQIGSGYRSIARQTELWEASDKSGREVARPGASGHNHGNAADLYWNGQSLKHAPKNVRDWVHKNVGAYGLKFPMDYEPWHVEIQETRGGEAFQGDVRIGGRGDVSRGTLFDTHDQDFYDNVIGAGFKAHFQAQTDKVAAYLAFANGETVLPMHMPDGSVVSVNVRGRLSETAATALDDALWASMSRERTIREDGEKDSAAAAAKRSSETRAGFMTGVLFSGREMDVNGKKVRAVMPTPADLLDAWNKQDLSDADFETLSKAITVDRPDKSDETVLRNAYRMVARGEDPEGFLLENLERIATTDAERLQGYHRTRTNSAGELNPQQKSYLDWLEGRFAQGMLDKFDEGRNERKGDAVLEYKERVLAGDDPKAVAEEIAERSKFSLLGEGFGSMTPPVPRPRFFVADPALAGRIDGAATFAALQKALADRELSGAEFDRNLRYFDEFVAWQDQQAAAEAP